VPRQPKGQAVRSPSPERWTRRIDALRELKQRYAQMALYERAGRAHLTLERAYRRWAQEIFFQRQA
jgi:hypothetical protein